MLYILFYKVFISRERSPQPRIKRFKTKDLETSGILDATKTYYSNVHSPRKTHDVERSGRIQPFQKKAKRGEYGFRDLRKANFYANDHGVRNGYHVQPKSEVKDLFSNGMGQLSPSYSKSP